MKKYDKYTNEYRKVKLVSKKDKDFERLVKAISNANTITIPLEEYERLKEAEEENTKLGEDMQSICDLVKKYREENKKLIETIEKIKYYRIKLL